MENLHEYLKSYKEDEFIIESNKDAIEDFEQFISNHPDVAQTEIDDSMDGTEIISLIIENAPAYIEAIVALVVLLRKKKVEHKIVG